MRSGTMPMRGFARTPPQAPKPVPHWCCRRSPGRTAAAPRRPAVMAGAIAWARRACWPQPAGVPRKREGLGWLHEALAERGIPCEQPEKQDLAEHPAAQDIIALLDALVSTAHDLSLARALRSPVFGLGDDALARVARLCRRASQAA